VDFLEANRSAILTKLEKRTQYFSESASDVRPAKTVGNSDVFPCALACFIDCFSGLPAQERSTDQGCMQYDVLLSQFLFDQRNVGVVTHIDQHIAAVSPVIEAFKQDQALMVQPKMEQSLPASTKRADASVNEDFSSPLRSIQSPNQQTPTKPPRKKRQMVIEEPENRVGMSLN
jgi:hypothetical protein